MPPNTVDHRMMRKIHRQEIDTILKDYRFTEKDRLNLRSLESDFHRLLLPQIIPGFYSFIFEFEHAKVFLHCEEILKRHEEGLRKWFDALFEGEYGERYFEMLRRISETHVRIGLPTHYVHAAFSYVRRRVIQWLQEEGRIEEIASFNKILDINLDILSLSYRHEEHQRLLDDIVLLRESVNNGKLLPYVQPIYAEKDAEVITYECLMRLCDPQTHKVVSIFPLLDTARTIHLYEGLMELMVDKSLRIFENLTTPFSLNLSYDDIANTRFRRYFLHKVMELPHPERLTIEILETDVIEDFEVVKSFFDALRHYGCGIAIDDFGSGYSSFKNIMHLHPDTIKIDGSLILELERSESSVGIIKGIVKTAKSVGAKTVAEYVADEELYRKVKALGIDYVQGYYLGKPFDARKLLEEQGIRES